MAAMKKLYCTLPGCKNWILTGPDFSLARRRGWDTWTILPSQKRGTAYCPGSHSNAAVTVGDVRKALRGLPADQTVLLNDGFEDERHGIGDLVSSGKRARNLDNFPDPPTKKGTDR